MKNTTEIPSDLRVTCSRSRLAAVLGKLNTKGFMALDHAERLVLNAHDADTLLTVSDETLVNGCKVGRFYQVNA